MGSFNNWEYPVSMKKSEQDTFVCNLLLKNGTYDYKYRINDVFWTTNRTSPIRHDQHGNINNVLYLNSFVSCHENLVR